MQKMQLWQPDLILPSGKGPSMAKGMLKDGREWSHDSRQAASQPPRAAEHLPDGQKGVDGAVWRSRAEVRLVM